MITQFLVWLLTFLIGYYLGTKRNAKKDLVTLERLVREKGGQIHLLPHSDLKPGIIRRPTVEQLKKIHQDDKIKAEKAAMKETLDEIPELRQARREP